MLPTEDLFLDPILLGVLRNDWLAIYSLAGSVVCRLGGQCDDRHDALNELDWIAGEMGCECSAALQTAAPAKDMCSMVEWAWWEAGSSLYRLPTKR